MEVPDVCRGTVLHCCYIPHFQDILDHDLRIIDVEERL
jgi:hypothetical protein